MCILHRYITVQFAFILTWPTGHHSKVMRKIDLNRTMLDREVRWEVPLSFMRISEYRSRQGKFTNLDELKQVKGIGDFKYQSIKKYFIISE